MKLRQFIFVILLILINLNSIFAQEFAEGEYWYGEMSKYKSDIWEYKNFTKDDVIKAQKIRDLIKQSKPKDEWEGIYFLGNDVGEGENALLWDSENGFVKYYFYHTLKTLKFGDVENKNDVLKFQYQNSLTAQKNKPKLETIVKVKVGNLHYLVPEDSMKNFLEDCVGVLPKNPQDYPYNYWFKIDSSEQKGFGKPIIPLKYEYLRRSPIQGKIKRLGKRVIQRSENWEGKIEDDGIKYFITLNVGKKNGVRKDVEFYIPKLKELATVEKVSANYSIASIFRTCDEKNKEICSEDVNRMEEHPCLQISVGMTAKTISTFE